MFLACLKPQIRYHFQELWQYNSHTDSQKGPFYRFQLGLELPLDTPGRSVELVHENIRGILTASRNQRGMGRCTDLRKYAGGSTDTCIQLLVQVSSISGDAER